MGSHERAQARRVRDQRYRRSRAPRSSDDGPAAAARGPEPFCVLPGSEADGALFLEGLPYPAAEGGSGTARKRGAWAQGPGLAV